MHIVSPLSQCVSIEKRDRFLDYISKIAPVTSATEPNCHGYAWFRSADDNDVVPSHWLRGFEVYTSKDASHIEHRASDEYKAFRGAVGVEGLLARPSDLEFWHPARVGFLNKGLPGVFQTVSEGSALQYIVTDEFKTKPGEKEATLELLGRVAEVARGTDEVLSFWILDRVRDDGSVPDGFHPDSLYVFMRFRDKVALNDFSAGSAALDLDSLDSHCTERRRTTWVESGIGFLGR